jgi:hypothetical protein
VTQPKAYGLPLLLAVITALGFTSLFALTIFPHGTSLDMGDEGAYLLRAVYLVHGEGIATQHYRMASDQVTMVYSSHHAPLISLAYALLLWLGLPLTLATSVFVLGCWLALLSGIGILAYRLSDSPLVVSISIIIASLTHAYLRIYESGLSEVLFLPLLVWIVVLMVRLPQQPHSPLKTLIGAAVLLALLMLTRYVGIVIFTALAGWWVWWRIFQRRWRDISRELPILLMALIPPGLWVGRNILISNAPAGSQFKASEYTFADGLTGIIFQSAHLLFPALRTPQEFTAFADLGIWAHIITYAHFVLLLPLLGLLAVKLWQARPANQSILTPPDTPILPIAAAYLGLYLVLQPFFRFTPLDERDVTTLLCILQPWLLTVSAHLLRRYALPVLTGYAVVNILLILIPLTVVGIPRVVSVNPPAVDDLADNRAIWEYRLYGMPEWLLAEPFRTTTADRYHSDLLDLIRQSGENVVIVSNSRRPLFYTDTHPQPLPVSPIRLDDWLLSGTCQPETPVLIVLFDWDTMRFEFDDDQAALRAKCPDLPEPVVLEHALVYPLGAARQRIEP